MRCPFCAHPNSRVVDSRQASDGVAVRRRRECSDCERRFTTYERVEEVFPQIVKRDGSRESYDRKKATQGVRIACGKRPISTEQIDAVINRVERRLLEESTAEVPSDWLGAAITAELRDLDPVAYIRFASVYRGFNDIEQFLQELRQLDRHRGTSEGRDSPGED